MNRRKAGSAFPSAGRFNSSAKAQELERNKARNAVVTSEPSEASTDSGSNTSESNETVDTLSTTGSPVVAFSHVLNDLMLIPDDNLKHDVTLTPSRFSISSNTAVLRELNGQKIATFKCHSLATQGVMVTFGAIILKTLISMFRNLKNRENSDADGDSSLNYVDAINDIGSTTVQNPLSVKTFILRTYRGLTGPLALTSVGLSVIVNGWRSEMSMQGPRGDSHMRAQFQRPRNGYVIKVRGPGSSKVRTKWVLAMDTDSKTWRLSTIEFSDEDEARVLERRVELEFEEDATPAATVEAEAFEREQQAEAEIRAAREAALAKAKAQSGMLMGQGTDSDLMLTQLAMSGKPIMSDVSSDSGVGGMRRVAAGAEPAAAGEEPEKKQQGDAGEFATTTPLDEENRVRSLREEDIPMSGPGAELAPVDEPMDGGDIAVPTGEGPSLNMEIPMQLKQNDMFTDSKGGFTLDVTKRTTFPLALSGRIWVTPIFGSEMYTLRFDGETSAPRDVLAFATYIVRSSDSVQIAPLLLYGILTGAVLLVLAIMYTFDKNEDNASFANSMRKILANTGIVEEANMSLEFLRSRWSKDEQ